MMNNNKRAAIWATVAVLCFIAIYIFARGSRTGKLKDIINTDDDGKGDKETTTSKLTTAPTHHDNNAHSQKHMDSTKNGLTSVQPEISPAFCIEHLNFSAHQPFEGYYLVTMLSTFNGKKWEHYPNFTLEELQERDEEYIKTLQINANNEVIKQIHLFYTDEENLEVLNKRKLSNREKIIPVQRSRKIHMADFFLYASQALLDKPVIATNADIVIGEGFEYVNTSLLRDNKVLYSLSRHPSKFCGGYDQCEGYVGSHDTHVFRLKEPLNPAILLEWLNYRINLWRSENGLIRTMKRSFNFKAYNPCRVLFVHHYHCSKVHGNTAEANNTVDSVSGGKWSASDVAKGVAEPQNILCY